jgi:hypothetical protein
VSQSQIKVGLAVGWIEREDLLKIRDGFPVSVSIDMQLTECEENARLYSAQANGDL